MQQSKGLWSPWVQALAQISVASVGRRITAAYSGLFYPLLFTACFLCALQKSLLLEVPFHVWYYH